MSPVASSRITWFLVGFNTALLPYATMRAMEGAPYLLALQVVFWVAAGWCAALTVAPRRRKST